RGTAEARVVLVNKMILLTSTSLEAARYRACASRPFCQIEPFRREYNYGMRTVVILILLACVVYCNSLHAPFVFDDIVSVQHNQHVRLGDYFTYNPYLYLQPRSLLFLTFALNDWLDGQNVFGYHLVNLILHLLNGLLVFAIAVRIVPQAGPARSGSARSYALLAAAFFI